MRSEKIIRHGLLFQEVRKLAEFNFSIHYSQGKQNVIADTLS